MRLLTAREVASQLNISRSEVYRLAAAGVLPHVKLAGRVLRFPADELEAVIRAMTKGGAS